MEHLILTGYEFMTVTLPAFAAAGIFYVLYRKKGVEVQRWHWFWELVFAVYIFGVFHFTGAGTIFDAKLYGMEFRAGQINFFPFSDRDLDIVGYGLNVLLFMPLGFLLPVIWPATGKFWHILTGGFLLSMFIEISQLLNNRRTDVDDLILNTFGAILSYGLFYVYSRKIKQNSESALYGKYDACIYIVIMFLCRFFTFYEFGMAKFLYKF